MEQSDFEKDCTFWHRTETFVWVVSLILTIGIIIFIKNFSNNYDKYKCSILNMESIQDSSIVASAKYDNVKDTRIKLFNKDGSMLCKGTTIYIHSDKKNKYIGANYYIINAEDIKDYNQGLYKATSTDNKTVYINIVSSEKYKEVDKDIFSRVYDKMNEALGCKSENK